MKTRYQIILKVIILSSIVISSCIGLSYSISNLYYWKQDSTDTITQIKELRAVVNIIEVLDSENVEIIEQDEEIPKPSPYWDYIKMSLIHVDFSELELINSDVVGYLQVNGTNINYPFVQTEDNDYYLTHSFNKTYNEAGWVFLDYRNNKNLSDKNNIIYAHGRFDETMFGSLKNILSSGWLNNTDNYVIKLSTEKENSLWQVFSIYHIPTTTDYLQINFATDDNFLEFATTLLERSDYEFDTTVSANDKIITLSTCYNDDERVVLHAKLIKKEER